ncbi:MULTISPECIES: hypothetical protein [unclassified Mesorhizobium]|uniref:hypothetical protein n=1 Tax=unclassified Mesorhizobium TaxID=325217 RepID=UPI001FE0A315|nr:MULTISPECIES: hypothetical protein [unclassified Mesorhizobium]
MMMIDIFSFELANARLRVKRAERSLKQAKLADDGCVAVNLALCDRIRSEQRRVSEARQRMTKIDANSPASNHM